MSDRFAWASGLVNRLIELAKPDAPDRAALAHLRRGLVGSPDYTLARVGWLFCSVPDDREDRALDNAMLVAGLFAWVKGECPQNENTNFGRAFGSGLSEEDKRQREKRFIDLIDADASELPHKLRQAITLIEGVGLDWVMLIRHLIRWDHPDRRVQKEWARGFWSNPVTEKGTADEPAEQPTSR